MTSLNSVQTLFRQIQTLAKHEKVTKEVLGQLSRGVLSLHLNEGDNRHNVNVVNKLLSVLSPANQRIARLFFVAFLPYAFDNEANTFGKLIKKEEKRELKYLAIASFLHEEDNDIWSWQAEHINMEAKPVDYSAKITKTIEVAMREDKGAFTPSQVLQAVFAAGVSVQDVVAMLDTIAKTEEAKAA